MTTDYYPVEGHDLTTGYKSIFYVKEEQYLNAEVGSKIKKSLAVIGDDLPTAPNNLKD